MKLTVGQKLWLVRGHRKQNNQREVTVTKVGRKWAEIGFEGRIDMDTLTVDSGGYMSSGACYQSKEDYDRFIALQGAWQAFRDRVSREHGPAQITVDELRRCANIIWGDDKLRAEP